MVYLVIYYNSLYNDQVNRLKELRENMGYNVSLKQVNSETYNTIKKEVNELYEKGKCDYLLLVGNREEVPTLMKDGISERKTATNQTTDKAASDNSYGVINNKLDIPVGRLSSGDNKYSRYKTNELTNEEKKENIKNQVDKIIEYEKMVDDNKDEEWMKKVLGIASNEGKGGGIDGKADNEYMRLELLNLWREKKTNFIEMFDGSQLAGYSFEHAELDEKGDPKSEDIRQVINKGVSYLMYAGHANETLFASSNFSVNDVDKLDENHKYFVSNIVGCSAGSHDEEYLSIAEALQCAKNKGSVCTFGSSILMSWLPPMHMQKKFNNLLKNNNNKNNIGDLFKESVNCDEFRPSELGGNNNYPDFWHYTLFGDPTMRFLLNE